MSGGPSIWQRTKMDIYSHRTINSSYF